MKKLILKKTVIIIIVLLATSTVSAVIPLGFSQTPYINCVPSIGYVGDLFIVNGYEFDDYVGDYVTIYFESGSSGSYTLLWNDTITSSDWQALVGVPESWGGPRDVHVRTSDGTIVLASDTYYVLAKLEITPDPIYNEWQKVQVIGTGFSYGDADSPDGYLFYIDNSLYFGRSENWAAAISDKGNILTEFAAAGFRPGLHEVHVIGDWDGYYYPTIAVMATFTVLTNGDPIVEYLESINGTVVSISDGVATLETVMGQTTVSLAQLDAKIVALDGTIATISTAVGQIETDLSALDAKIVEVNGTIATISTAVGQIETDLSALDAKIDALDGTNATISTTIGQIETDISTIDAKIVALDGTIATITTTVGQIRTDISTIDGKVTTINGDVATIKTDVGTFEGKITDIEGTMATVETDLGTVKVDLSDAQTQLSDMTANDDKSLSFDMLPLWVAVGFALVAAIGSIAGVIVIQRKMKK